MKASSRVTDVAAIRKAMIDKGFKTICSLASASGVNRSTLGKILDGKEQPSSDVMFKLADTLGFSPHEAGTIIFAENLRNA